MTTIVIMPGGFHPFHAGHAALYQSAQRAFPDAEVFVAATNDTSTRPFPFAVKEKLAKLAGVEAGHFVQVKSPFRAEEITAKFDPARDTLIFVRSEKDSTKPPQAGGVKKDGSLAYLQPLLGAKKLEPFAKHAYMAYLPTVEFGPGMTSATEIRTAWPQLNEKRKQALVMSLYPRTQGNAKLAATVVGLLDAAIGSEQGVAEGYDDEEHPIRDDDNEGRPGKQRYPGKLKPKGVAEGLGPQVGDEVYYGKRLVGWFKGYSEHGKIITEPNYEEMGDEYANRDVYWDPQAKITIRPEQGVAEGAPIIVMPRSDRFGTKKDQPKQRYMGDIVPPTKPPSTEKRGVKGRPGQRPMPKYDEGMAATLESSRVDLATDPELTQARRFAQQHYPEFGGDEDMAFAKWVQRGLGHSEKNDKDHDRKLKQLTAKIDNMQLKIQQQAKNPDYMEESSRKK